MNGMNDLAAFLEARWAERGQHLDEDEQVALEASRDGRGRTPTGEHWHWVEPDHDQVLTLDPMLDEYLNDGGRAALRSIEEYPTSMSYTLPRFVVPDAGEQRTVDAMHIARWDPARVLAEVEQGRQDIAAKRHILAEHQAVSLTYWPTTVCGICSDPDADPVDDPLGSDGPWTPNASWPCRTVRLLALPFVRHPDFRTEWWPTFVPGHERVSAEELARDDDTPGANGS